MKILLAQYQVDTNIMDQELLAFNSQYKQVKNRAKFESENQELKEFLAKLNKDIISKKQAKITKDRTAFVEGYAYRWSNRSVRRGQGNRNWHNASNRNFVSPDEEFESDSSMSSSISQVHQSQSTSRQHPQSGLRKRGHHGGGYSQTPNHKKKPDQFSKFSHTQAQTQGVHKQGDRRQHHADTSHQTYIGPIAAQALHLMKSLPTASQASQSLPQRGVDTRYALPPSTSMHQFNTQPQYTQETLDNYVTWPGLPLGTTPPNTPMTMNLVSSV